MSIHQKYMYRPITFQGCCLRNLLRSLNDFKPLLEPRTKCAVVNPKGWEGWGWGRVGHSSDFWKFRGGAQGQPLLSVEVFHKILIWSNINQIFGIKCPAKCQTRTVTEEGYYLWSKFNNVHASASAFLKIIYIAAFVFEFCKRRNKVHCTIMKCKLLMKTNKNERAILGISIWPY